MKKLILPVLFMSIAGLSGFASAGGGRVLLAGGENAVYSPDGTRLAFQKKRGVFFDIGVLELATGDVTWVSEGAGNAIFPTWTPKGELVYVYGNDTNTSYAAWHTGSKDGYNLYLFDKGHVRQLTRGRWRDSTPSVAADGTVYFARSEGVYLSDHALLWEMPLEDPSRARRLRGSSFASGAGINQPSRSPDGHYLVWAEIYGGNWGAWNLRLARTDNPTVDRVLIPMRQTAFEPRWCPDSRTIVYSGFEEGDPTWGVYLMDVFSRRYRRICSGRGGAVSPDGRKLAYSVGGELRERVLSAADYPCAGNSKVVDEMNPSAEPGRVLLAGGEVKGPTRVPFAGHDFGRDRTLYCRVKVWFNGGKSQQDFINVDFAPWGNLAFRVFCSDRVPHLSTMFDESEWIPMLGPRPLTEGEYTLTGIRGGDGRLYFSTDGSYPLMRPMTQWNVPLDGSREVLLSRNLTAGAQWHRALDGTGGELRAVDAAVPASRVLAWEVGSGWPEGVPRLLDVFRD